MRKIRIGLAQINTTVGDLKGNRKKIGAWINNAKKLGIELIAFPELSITGYPPEDLLLKPKFIEDNIDCLNSIVKATKNITAVIGFVDREDDIYNAAAICHNCRIAGVYRKIFLPNYGVFDEDRYFQSGNKYPVFEINGITIGVNICEDIWYARGPTKMQALVGDAELIINISASPYHYGKGKFRERMLSTRAADESVIIAFTNLVGGQDELIFDGNSLIFDQLGNIIAHGEQFEEDLVIADLDIDAVFRERLHDPRRRKEELANISDRDKVEKIPLPKIKYLRNKPPIPERKVENYSTIAEIYHALVLGTRDYVKKNGFKNVLIGLSGGIDSSLTAVIAVDTLGPKNVTGISMPSIFSSEEGKKDIIKLAKKLGIKFKTIPIDSVFQSYLQTLKKEFKGLKQDVTEENIQARIRGNILMAISNKYNWLVLTTGNKSEMGVGYCTLYGDMAGGFAVLKDVPKTMVYELVNYRNSIKNIIPDTIIKREPSAELRPNQKDVDSIPPYNILDPILQAYVENDRSAEEICSMGFDKKVVKKVIDMVDRNEYKRRQGPPGIKITPRAFGKDRRVPITNRYRSF